VPDRPERPVAEFRGAPPEARNGPPRRAGRPRRTGEPSAPPGPVLITWATPTSGQLGVPFSFCPGCGSSLDGPRAFVQELWVSQESVFHVWCPSCGFVGNVVPVHRMIGHEAEG
jgi:hypothetical protein